MAREFMALSSCRLAARLWEQTGLPHDRVASELACPAERWEGCRCAQALSGRVPPGRCRVARNRGQGVTVEQVATDFGVHPMTLWKWMRRADIDDGTKPGTTSQESAELQKRVGGSSCWSRRTRFCDGPRPICRRHICREKDLPDREGVGRGRGVRHGCVPGVEARQTALLPLAGPAGDRCRAAGGPIARTRCSTRTVTTRGSEPIPGRRSAWRRCHDDGPDCMAGSAGTIAGGACSARSAARAGRPARQSTTTWSAVTSPQPVRTGCGSPTSPSTPPAKANSVSA